MTTTTTDESELRFPSGATVASIKKTARRLTKERGLSNLQALDELAIEHGIHLPWADALWFLQHGGCRQIRQEVLTPLLALGFTLIQVDLVRHFLMRSPGGIILVCGRRGAGRTTTSKAIASALLRLAPGKTGIEVKTGDRSTSPEGGEAVPLITYEFDAQHDWAAAAKTLLRANAELMLFHEIQVDSLASLPFHVAMSGHLAIVEAEAPLRGVEAFASLLGKSIAGGEAPPASPETKLPFDVLIIEQGLVDVVCTSCSKSLSRRRFDGAAELRDHLQQLNVPSRDALTAGEGCSACVNGYMDKTALVGVYEADLAFYQSAMDLANGLDVDIREVNRRLRIAHPETAMDANKLEKIATGIMDARDS